MNFIIKIYIFIFLTILSSIIYLYGSLAKTEETLSNNMEKLFVLQAREISQNIANHLQVHLQKNVYQELKNQPSLRDRMEHSLSVIITENYKYVYVLYRDEKGNYRYLLDGSKIDKGEFDDKLNVSPKWDHAYDSQKDLIINQTDLDTLWITYLKPFVLKDKTEAIIAIDFSVNLPHSIREATKPMRDILVYIFASIILLLLILLYQTLLNLKTKKDSLIDPLTQIYNRHYLRDFLNSKKLEKYQIMMLDIDYFKKVNDNYGHNTGDYILKEVASMLKEEIRSSDVLVRFGGEEFLVFIQKDRNNPEVVVDIAQRMRKKIEAKFFSFEKQIIRITISIGITTKTEHFKSINNAIKNADNMLYIAKKEGRNRVVYNRESGFLDSNMKTISDVKEALETEKLFCEFQAIYDIEENRIVKYEALVRIDSQDGTIIYPNMFLETITQTAVYRDLTKRVMQIVFQKIQENALYISINLNFSDILDDEIFLFIVQELRSNSKIASFLSIELLEYEAIAERKIIGERLLEIKKYGTKIAIDDFGSGYANYDIFNLLPIDIIKIDGSLVKNINKSHISYSIVKSIAILAQELGLEVIAEFVETDDILDVLQEMNIKYGQGFYLAKPNRELK